MKQESITEIMGRCIQFRSLQLPGQGAGVHMGTAYLVGDLERALIAHRKALVALVGTDDPAELAEIKKITEQLRPAEASVLDAIDVLLEFRP